MKNTTKRSGRKVISLSPRIRLNRRGSGVWRASRWARRIAAFTWELRSASDLNTWYRVYVDHGYGADDDDRDIRCQCDFFLFNGYCKHTEHVLELEERYATQNPQIYALEIQRKYSHPRPTPGPYPGGLRR